MNRCPQYGDDELLSRLIKADEAAFLEIYFRYGKKLKQYIYGYVRNTALSEDIVQEIFVDLWHRRPSLPGSVPLDSYLFRAAKNQILNHIRSEGVRKKYVAHFNSFLARQFDNSNEEAQEVNALQASIEKGISELPESHQTAFRLSRYDHVCIKDIAHRMKVSPRTVEGYLTKTLAHLRISLGEFIAFLALCLWT